MTVKVVIDSASDFPADLAEKLGITIVPCNVHFGTEQFKDGVDITPDEFYRRLTEGSVFPKTSQPSPGDFVEIYDQLGSGADGIVSIHVSAKLSGTYNSAIQAKSLSSATCPIEVLDSAQGCMGIGLVAIVAARAALDGADIVGVVEVARDAMTRAQAFFLLNTLEYLERGGRIGKAKAMLGSVLNIKPILIMKDGEVHELGKARTFSKGIRRLRDIITGFAPIEALCVLYTTTPDLAHEISQDLSDLLPEGENPMVLRVGPTIGTYTGPGVIGISLISQNSS